MPIYETFFNLFKLTSIFYNFSLITEIIITSVWWIFLVFFQIKITQVTSSEFIDEIYNTVFTDIGNLDHSIPLLILLSEFFFYNKVPV